MRGNSHLCPSTRGIINTHTEKKRKHVVTIRHQLLTDISDCPLRGIRLNQSLMSADDQSVPRVATAVKSMWQCNFHKAPGWVETEKPQLKKRENKKQQWSVGRGRVGGGGVECWVEAWFSLSSLFLIWMQSLCLWRSHKAPDLSHSCEGGGGGALRCRVSTCVTEEIIGSKGGWIKAVWYREQWTHHDVMNVPPSPPLCPSLFSSPTSLFSSFYLPLFSSMFAPSLHYRLPLPLCVPPSSF